MDFEKEAREIAAFCNADADYVPPSDELKYISQALRRAFIAGQIDMRERAKGVLENRMFETSGAEYGLASDPERAYQRNFNAVMQTSAGAIRSLPTLDNPIPDSGKEMK